MGSALASSVAASAPTTALSQTSIFPGVESRLGQPNSACGLAHTNPPAGEQFGSTLCLAPRASVRHDLGSRTSPPTGEQSDSVLRPAPHALIWHNLGSRTSTPTREWHDSAHLSPPAPVQLRQRYVCLSTQPVQLCACSAPRACPRDDGCWGAVHGLALPTSA